jgi:hypothetical protein
MWTFGITRRTRFGRRPDPRTLSTSQASGHCESMRRRPELHVVVNIQPARMRSATDGCCVPEPAGAQERGALDRGGDSTGLLTFRSNRAPSRTRLRHGMTTGAAADAMPGRRPAAGFGYRHHPHLRAPMGPRTGAVTWRTEQQQPDAVAALVVAHHVLVNWIGRQGTPRRRSTPRGCVPTRTRSRPFRGTPAGGRRVADSPVVVGGVRHTAGHGSHLGIA